MTLVEWIRAYERKEKEITKMIDSNGDLVFDDL
jgi:hypothetical protein